MTRAPEHSLAHAGFTLVRDYPVPVESVWNAFADGDQKRRWFGAGDEWSHVQWQHNFHVGGHDIAEGRFHGTWRSRYEAYYTDIVPLNRIVTAYDMWRDDVHISTSVASYEFETVDGGTRLTHTEHGIHFDGFDSDGTGREAGSKGLLDLLETLLTR